MEFIKQFFLKKDDSELSLASAHKLALIILIIFKRIGNVVVVKVVYLATW
jgi:hypothetical protein